ncbi:hypothetical protein SELR_pSRC400670 (plasmid) [Selenomonas ruminantium subsp. lactilytica TAM6421]|uniref:Uncharacterized protein n=1 Tax=Selenomonas ruminantium subsp. lactilytica (strain NBRC 103574 / TAM6421) TaxID=927704 RepID=I0GVD1_SELRL|nr:hypothetical protein [Selenomonas ruminantium]BAL84718.1 hypothetical protein SELR_pSRC400670 [Selenomonas ruminantium subsp. lactilytica TAM6421]
MLRKTIATLTVTTVLGVGLWFIDDFYTEKTLEWYEDSYAYAFEKTNEKPDEDNELGRMTWLLCWRIANNFTPSLSDWLDPPPKVGKRETVEYIQKQGYYYDAWKGTLVEIPESEEK